ncbi:MAG: glycosyltransferase, partial [Candidatus Aenigmarchaeota archaeon]|nr:glycosyltransferase [Candidatus Aenigmarchaeota archaeon]
VFNVATSGVAELITIRNHSIPILCFCHTTLRPVHEMYDYYKSERFTGWKKIPFIMSSKGYRFIEKSAWKHMDFVLCNSLNTKNRIINADLADEGRVEVLNPGVDTKRFKKGRYDHYFLVPGRIQWYKRFELAIDAFKMFQKRARTKFKLKIVGGASGKDAPVLEFLKDRAKDVKDVEFIINSSDEEMTKLYSNCYAVLFTAKDEDWGIVPLEAMACGKPVISVNEGGPKESITDGETGFLISADPNEFADKMLHLAENPPLAKKMGRSGMESVKRYDWKHFVKRYDEHIERLGQRQPT